MKDFTSRHMLRYSKRPAIMRDNLLPFFLIILVNSKFFQKNRLAEIRKKVKLYPPSFFKQLLRNYAQGYKMELFPDIVFIEFQQQGTSFIDSFFGILSYAQDTD